jgi:hypothetical protein
VQRDLHEHFELARADVDHQLILYGALDIPNFPNKRRRGQ